MSLENTPIGRLALIVSGEPVSRVSRLLQVMSLIERQSPTMWEKVVALKDDKGELHVISRRPLDVIDKTLWASAWSKIGGEPFGAVEFAQEMPTS